MGILDAGLHLGKESALAQSRHDCTLFQQVPVWRIGGSVCKCIYQKHMSVESGN